MEGTLLDTTTKNLASMRSYSVKQFANSWSENIDNYCIKIVQVPSRITLLLNETLKILKKHGTEYSKIEQYILKSKKLSQAVDQHIKTNHSAKALFEYKLLDYDKMDSDYLQDSIKFWKKLLGISLSI